MRTQPACCLRPWIGPAGLENSQLCYADITLGSAKAADSAPDLWRCPDLQTLRGLVPGTASLPLSSHLFWKTVLPSGNRTRPRELDRSNIRLLVCDLKKIPEIL